jgi:hypothetical protein
MREARRKRFELLGYRKLTRGNECVAWAFLFRGLLREIARLPFTSLRIFELKRITDAD